MSKKILVLEKNTWLQAYHIRNLEIGILQDKIPWINEKYINCYYKPACGALFDYCMPEQRYFEKSGVMLVQKFRFKKSIYQLDIFDFLKWAKDLLSGGWYIMGYFDEYYIPEKRSYKRRHFRHSIEMEIYGVKVKTLPPLKAMIQLILHHYKDMNSLFLLATRKSIKYDMFKDVYYLLKNNLDAIPLDKLYAMSAEYEIIPYVFYVLYYTGQVFDDDVLKQYIEAFRTPEGESLLNCYGLCEKERREWKCDFKTRLDSDNLYDLIKEDLTERDKEKIAINKRVFLGISE